MAELLERLGGTFVPLLTPVGPDGGPDLDSLARLTEHVLSGGADGIWVCGTSAEFHLLADGERALVIANADEEIGSIYW